MTESDGLGISGGEILNERRIRYYSPELKRQIVEETFAPGASVAGVARRHGVNDNLVFEWRKKYREGKLPEPKPARRATPPSGSDLIRVGVIDAEVNLRPVAAARNSSSSTTPSPSRVKAPSLCDNMSTVADIIEIELPNRVKVRVGAAVSEAVLRRVLAVVGACA